MFVYSRAEGEWSTATTSALELLLSYGQTLYELAQSKTTREPYRELIDTLQPSFIFILINCLVSLLACSASVMVEK